jgi:hypothetical protein
VDLDTLLERDLILVAEQFTLKNTLLFDALLERDLILVAQQFTLKYSI